MIHHPQAPQMAKQLTIRGNIKHNLLFSALREILSGIASGYFTNFLSWLQTLDVPGADASDVESHYHQDSSGRQHTHTDVFTQRQ